MFSLHVWPSAYTSWHFVGYICCVAQCKTRILDLTASHNNINPLECKDNYSATWNNMKLVHKPLMGGLLHLVYSEEGTGRGRSQCTNHLIAVQWSV